ncbi:hypothetical protein [Methanocella arvoryzae]|uniref:hypothetical protein n=1 Tax=Methanocella arvoryzae TaxID=1175445 RepID=UPI00032593B7|nr:hypothetical protein [Methanocella arvoryzae]
MAEQKRSVEDIVAEDIEREKRLNREQSSQSPDRVEDFNRRADRRREEYARANYDESQSDTGE